MEMPEWRRLDGVDGELLIKRELVYAMQSKPTSVPPVTRLWLRNETAPFEIWGTIEDVARVLGFSVI